MVADSHEPRPSSGDSAVELGDVLELIHLAAWGVAPSLVAGSRIMPCHVLLDDWLVIRPTGLVLNLVEFPAVLIEFKVWLRSSVSVLPFDVVCLESVHLIHVDVRVGRLHEVPAFLSSRTAVVVTHGHDVGSCCGNGIMELRDVLQLVDFPIF